jgi:hypothetical protein
MRFGKGLSRLHGLKGSDPSEQDIAGGCAIIRLWFNLPVPSNCYEKLCLLSNKYAVCLLNCAILNEPAVPNGTLRERRE